MELRQEYSSRVNPKSPICILTMVTIEDTTIIVLAMLLSIMMAPSQRCMITVYICRLAKMLIIIYVCRLAKMLSLGKRL
jgi:hypothetical protein